MFLTAKGYHVYAKLAPNFLTLSTPFATIISHFVQHGNRFGMSRQVNPFQIRQAIISTRLKLIRERRLRASRVLTHDVRHVKVTKRRQLSKLRITLLIGTMTCILLNNRRSRLTTIKGIQGTRRLAAIIKAGRILHIKDILLRSSSGNTFILTPIVMRITRVIKGRRLSILLTLRDTQRITPRFRRLLPSVNTKRFANHVGISLNAKSIPSDFTFDSGNASAIREILGIHLFFVHAMFYHRGNGRRIVKYRFIPIISRPRLRQIFLTRYAKGLNGMNTSMTLELIKRLRCGKARCRASKGGLTRVLSNDRLSNMLTKSTSTLRLTRFGKINCTQCQDRVSRRL